MKTVEEILNGFVNDFDFENIQDLKDNIDDVDIMENVISLGTDLDECDTNQIIKAMKLIDRLKEFQVLYNFINKVDYSTDDIPFGIDRVKALEYGKCNFCGKWYGDCKGH